MTVTQIQELDKKRVKVYLDGEFAFVLYKGELREYKVREGEELDHVSYRQITEDLLPKRAKLRAMNLLQKKDYTERQLRDKLSEGLYPPEIDQIRKLLEKKHYDPETADFKEKQKIMAFLMRKGYGMEMIRRGMEE